MEKRTRVTTLITAIEGGDRQAAEDLLPLLYDELLGAYHPPSVVRRQGLAAEGDGSA